MNIKKIAIHQKVLENELLSSWLLRFSQKMKVKYHTFCDSLFSHSAVDLRDVDLTIEESHLRNLSHLTFHSYDTLYGTTLKSYDPFLAMGSDLKYWILTRGTYHRIPKNNYLCCCPSCLINDVEPYFRKSWRLITSLVCTYCGNELIDCCPKCNKPISFLRLDFNHKEKYVESPLCICSSCGYDLREAKVKKAEKMAISYQSEVDRYLTEGFTISLNYSHQYFKVLEVFIKLLNSSKKRHQEFNNWVSSITGWNDFEKKTCRSRAIKNTKLEERRSILLKAHWLISKPEEELMEIFRANRFWSCFIKQYTAAEDIPYWFYEPMNRELSIKYSEWKKYYPNSAGLSSYITLGIKLKNNFTS